MIGVCLKPFAYYFRVVYAQVVEDREDLFLLLACQPLEKANQSRCVQRAGRSIPVALVMLKAKVDKQEAVRRLAKSDGNVRLAIEENVLEL